LVVDAHRRVIAIDGPAGAGKSTIAKALASRLNMKYLDTGAMYRAVTFEAMLRELDLDDQGAITVMAQECDLHVGLDRVIINGHDATQAIRGTEVTGSVSKVAANSGVRNENSPAGVGYFPWRRGDRRSRHCNRRLPRCSSEGVSHCIARSSRATPR